VQLEDAVVVITGAGHGIGAAMARRFAGAETHRAWGWVGEPHCTS
jgi:NAD(P)-dependent dehydrogenase (short-subunit alcohol dehydrogenase family)